MIKNKEILIPQLLFFMFIGSLGSFINFINLYLSQVVGLPASQIGFITSIGLITTVVMNPIWGYLADKTGKHILILKMAFLSAAGIGALYYGARSFLLILIVVILFESLRAPMMPMLEYISSNYCEKYQYDFGKVRVFGSWGFLLVAMATGFMVAGLELELFGRTLGFDGFISLEFATFGIFIMMNVVAFILLFLLPKADRKTRKVSAHHQKTFGKQEVKELLTNRRFVFILVLTMIGFMTVESAYSYATMHLVETLGASASIVSWMTFFMVVPEVILLPLGTGLTLKFGFKNWYVFTFLTMILRLGIAVFATSPLLFAVSGTVHALMIVMHTIGTIAYIRKVVSPNALGLAFTMLASSIALSRATLSFIFGWIYENMNSFATFRIAALVVLVALVMAVKSKHLKEVGDEIGVI